MGEKRSTVTGAGRPAPRKGRVAYDTAVKKAVLFLCTGNAARSQMAEGVARLDHGDRLDVVSAGSRPAGAVHPAALAALEEIGAPVEGARSKSAQEFRDRPFDVVVTVCDSAALDCPTWPNAKRVEHWPIEDPSFEPDPVRRATRFQETRDDLRRRIDALVRELFGETAPPAPADLP